MLVRFDRPSELGITKASLVVYVEELADAADRGKCDDDATALSTTRPLEDPSENDWTAGAWVARGVEREDVAAAAGVAAEDDDDDEEDDGGAEPAGT